jgi:hypothetical protein
VSSSLSWGTDEDRRRGIACISAGLSHKLSHLLKKTSFTCLLEWRFNVNHISSINRFHIPCLNWAHNLQLVDGNRRACHDVKANKQATKLTIALVQGAMDVPVAVCLLPCEPQPSLSHNRTSPENPMWNSLYLLLASTVATNESGTTSASKLCSQASKDIAERIPSPC